MLHKVLRIDYLSIFSDSVLCCMGDAILDATVITSDGETILLKLSTAQARSQLSKPEEQKETM